MEFTVEEFTTLSAIIMKVQQKNSQSTMDEDSSTMEKTNGSAAQTGNGSNQTGNGSAAQTGNGSAQTGNGSAETNGKRRRGELEETIPLWTVNNMKNQPTKSPYTPQYSRGDKLVTIL